MSETHPILVLFVDAERDGDPQVKPYISSEHLASARKFIYWSAKDEDVLVVGSPGIARHGVLREIVGDHYYYLMRQAPSGAGEIGHSGMVRSWGSSGFDLETPEALHLIILKALGIE